MADSPGREEIARSNGFESYANLLNASRLLPLWSTTTVKTYIARRGSGHWFIWDDDTRSPEDGIDSDT